MKTILKKRKLLVFSSALLLLLVTGFLVSPHGRACPALTLSSPPSTLEMCSNSCNNVSGCQHICQNTLTLTAASIPCGPYTWTFTNNTTGCVTVFTTNGSSASLSFVLCGGVGDSISLVISTSGSTSGTYNFTGVACS